MEVKLRALTRTVHFSVRQMRERTIVAIFGRFKLSESALDASDESISESLKVFSTKAACDVTSLFSNSREGGKCPSLRLPLPDAYDWMVLGSGIRKFLCVY